MTDRPTPEQLAAWRALAEKAHEELMRVTGMGKYAKRIQGGPPNPPICHIPADVEHDTDIVIGAALNLVPALLAEVERLTRERDTLWGGLMRFAEFGRLLLKCGVKDEEEFIEIKTPGARGFVFRAVDFYEAVARVEGIPPTAFCSDHDETLAARARAEKAEAEAAELRDWKARAIPRILSVVAVDEIARGVDHTKAGASIQKRIAEALAPAAPEPPLLGPVPTPTEIDTFNESCSRCGGSGQVATPHHYKPWDIRSVMPDMTPIPCPACRKEPTP